VKSISPEAASDEDSWCWERSSIDVNVGTEDIKGIEFVQKGYWINIISTHEVDARIAHPDGSPTSLKIKVFFVRWILHEFWLFRVKIYQN